MWETTWRALMHQFVALTVSVSPQLSCTATHLLMQNPFDILLRKVEEFLSSSCWQLSFLIAHGEHGWRLAYPWLPQRQTLDFTICDEHWYYHQLTALQSTTSSLHPKFIAANTFQNRIDRQLAIYCHTNSIHGIFVWPTFNLRTFSRSSRLHRYTKTGRSHPWLWTTQWTACWTHNL